MIVAIFVFIALGVGVGIVSDLLYDDKLKSFIFCLVACTIILLMSLIIGGLEDNKEYHQYINAYKSYKATYESQINEGNLSDAETIGLFHQVAMANKELEEKKVLYKQWYYCLVDYKEIEKLEPIKINK